MGIMTSILSKIRLGSGVPVWPPALNATSNEMAPAKKATTATGNFYFIDIGSKEARQIASFHKRYKIATRRRETPLTRPTSSPLRILPTQTSGFASFAFRLSLVTDEPVDFGQAAVGGRVLGPQFGRSAQITERGTIVLLQHPALSEERSALEEQVGRVGVLRVEPVRVVERAVGSLIVAQGKERGAPQGIRTEEVGAQGHCLFERSACLRKAPQPEVGQAEVVLNLRGFRIELSGPLQWRQCLGVLPVVPVEHPERGELVRVGGVKKRLAGGARFLWGPALEGAAALDRLARAFVVMLAQLGRTRVFLLRLPAPSSLLIDTRQMIVNAEIARTRPGCLAQPDFRRPEVALLQVGRAEIVGRVGKGWVGGHTLQAADGGVQVAVEQVEPAEIVNDARVVGGLAQQALELASRLLPPAEGDVAHRQLVAAPREARIEVDRRLKFRRRLLVPLVLLILVAFADVGLGGVFKEGGSERKRCDAAAGRHRCRARQPSERRG